MTTIKSLLESGVITMETRVLGTLPMTGDGCIPTPDALVWVMPPHCANPAGIGFRILCMYSDGPASGDSQPKWEDCYSSREAALAAQAGAKEEK